MSRSEAASPLPPGHEGLTREERKSVTHGDFWIPEEEREKYKRALAALNRSGVPYIVSGAYAIYEHTGIYRETKDLDLFLQPEHIVEAARALRAEGFRTRLEQLSALEQEVRERNRIYEEVIGRFRSLIDAGQLSVSISRGRLVINLPQDILFESGSATIGADGRRTLGEVARVLADIPNRTFQVEGHTDNVPIATARFPSNWELAAARALSVVHLLQEQGVKPENISGAAYGEYQPVSGNEEPSGRRLNRRIEIVMLPNLDVIAGAGLPPEL